MNNFKCYKNPNGGMDWIPEDQTPPEDWVEVVQPDAPPDIFIEPPYSALRQNNYPFLGDQLDMLFHDIDNGVFGTSAKDSNWYKTIKSIKEEYPKPAE